MASPSAARLALLKGLFAASLYGFISISITFFNKAVLASYNFQYPNLMTLFQMLCSLLLLEMMRLTGKIHYATFNMKTAWKTFPLAISFVGMVLTGLAALKYLNIPMFNALRRITTLFTMIGEYYLVGTHESTAVQISVYAMVFGAIIAGFSDLEFTTIGYTLVALNCIFTAAYLLYIAKFGKQGLNTWGLMYYNNILSLPFVMLICVMNHDIQEVRTYPLISDPGFIVCFLFQSALAFLLNYSIFLCTNVNSALATSVTGQIKNIATTAVGFVTFQTERTRYSPINVFGIVLGVCKYNTVRFPAVVPVELM
jgi:solute carrier family 35 protein